MIYLSAKHIGIKRDQDRSHFTKNRIILCDGIGEFEESNKAAEITINHLLKANTEFDVIVSLLKAADDIKKEKIIGGTTLISALVELKESYSIANIVYLGNGSIFHLHGNFNELPASFGASNKPYLFSNLLIPHVDKDGALLRYISHNSKQYELTPSFIELSLSGLYGDVILLFSDGISSLEDDIIYIDDQQRIWRKQSEIVSIIICDLHDWLKLSCLSFSQKGMDDFLTRTLSKLKADTKLEDDASIGLIISESVLNYYKEFYHAS